MNTFYINLPEARDRREAIERNFREFAPPDATLTRVEATQPPQVLARGLQGKIRSTEIACLLSHRSAIAASMADEGHCLIVEDDALFGPSTFPLLPRLAALQDPAIDVIFLSALIADVGSIMNQIQNRRALVDRGELTLFDLSRVHFSCADAYIVKKEAKAKLVGLIDGIPSYDHPYDIILRHWVHVGAIRAVLTFPCLTSLSPLADRSDNGNANPTWHAFNAFRRLMAIDAKHYPGEIMRSIDAIDPDFYDQEATDLSRVLRVLLSRKLVIG